MTVMVDILVSVLAFIVAIGVLVAFHEFGHFWTARRLGVKVLRYSIGFGKPLWLRRSRRSGTEYVIAALPLGGYVRMLDEREGPVPENEKHLAFNNQPVWKRFLIVLAGPGFNFIFAVFAYWLMFMAGVTGIKPIVGEVPQDSPAYQAGLRSGSEITAVAGSPTPTWSAARTELLEAALGEDVIRLDVRGPDGGSDTLTLPLTGVSVDPQLFFDELGLQPLQPSLDPIIGELTPDMPAALAGLQSGDRIVTAGGQPINSWAEWVEWVQARPNTTHDVMVERGGELRTIELAISSVPGEAGDGPIGRIGALPLVDESAWDHLRAEVSYGPLAAVGAGLNHTWEMTALTVGLLGRMVIGDISWRNVSGPINIAQYAGYSAQLGLVPFLSFLAIVSISLGVLNLLPVPVLDGGHLMYYVVEFAKGSPVSERAQIVGQQIGLVLLLMLMSLAFYNDIARLVG